MRKYFLFLLLQVCSLLAVAQEICGNGIDDDGDGKIDLLDTDCVPSIYPLIKNPSFEKIWKCPVYYAQLDYAVGWLHSISNGNGSTELFHRCGECNYGLDDFVPYMPDPPPDGVGFAAFGDVKSLQGQGSYKEYVSTCIDVALEQDSFYVLEFYLGFMDPILGSTPGSTVASFSPVNISLFGNGSCSSIPYGSIADSTSRKCPQASFPAWAELVKVSVSGTAGQWTKVRAEFKSPMIIPALVLGPSCQASPYGADGDWGYYYLDQVLVYKKDAYDLPSITRAGDICSDTLTLTANMSPVPPSASYQWYKDGVALAGETGSLLHLTRGKYGEGYYSVMATVNQKSYLSAEATVFLDDADFLLADTVGLCGGSVTLHAQVKDAGQCFINYAWQDGTLDTFLTVNAPGTYWFETEKNGCLKRDSVVVIYQPAPALELGNDTTLCPGATLLLSAGPADQYLWQNSSTGQTFTAVAAGTYHVTVSSGLCRVSDTITVSYDRIPSVVFSSDTILCEGEQKQLAPEVWGDRFLWNTGATTPEITVAQPGTYILQVQNSCGTATTAVNIVRDNCLFFMPSAFTPDKDGLNDQFGLRWYGFIRQFEFKIFNRWGQTVFASNDPSRRWNGTTSGKESPQGVYVWMVRYTDWRGNNYLKKGTVALIR